MKQTQQKSLSNFNDSSKMNLSTQKNTKGGLFGFLMKTTEMVVDTLFRRGGNGNGNGVW